MRYPLETYVISHSKKGKINSILNPTAKRITHIFDAPEMLDDQDTPLQDPYLKILANGKREKLSPLLSFGELRLDSIADSSNFD